ncbi:MAG: hypothetical protein R6X20_09515 [Phycisphaerae bacterium]
MPKGMEIGHAVRVVQVRDTGRLQVRLERPEHSVTVRHAEGRRLRQLAFQVCLQRGRGVRPQRQHVLAPVLGVPRRHGDGGGRGVQVEGRPRQAPQFTRPQPRFKGQTVEHRLYGAGHTVPLRFNGRLSQKPPDFVKRQGPPVVPPVGLDVQPLEVGDGRLAGPAVPHRPPAELFDGPEIEVKSLGAEARLGLAIVVYFVGPQVAQEGHDVAARDVGPGLEAAAFNHPPRPARHKACVPGRVALVEERLLKVADVLHEGLGRCQPLPVQKADLRQPFPQPGREGVQPLRHDGVQGLTVGGVGRQFLDLAAQGVALATVGERRHPPHLAPVVAKLHVPLGGLALLAACVPVRRLEQTHRSPAFLTPPLVL